MRLRWLKNLSRPIQALVFSGLLFVFLILYLPLAKYIKPAITSLLFSPLRFCQDVSVNARQLLRFQDLAEENRSLRTEVKNLTAQLVGAQEMAQENQRLKGLLSLPQEQPYKMCAALVIGRDSSNWTQTAMINKGSSSGIRKGMAVISGSSLVGRVIEVASSLSKISLITGFNTKIPARIVRSRQEGVVFGDWRPGQNLCRIKYVQDVEVKDKVVSSGLGEIYPQGLLIGEVISVEEEESKLYKIAAVLPAAELAELEEVMVITGN